MTVNSETAQGSALRPYGWPMIISLGFLAAMGALHLDPIASSLPAMATELGLPPNATAYTVSAFFFGMMIGHVVIGPFSDIIGRRKTMMFGLVLLIIGSVACAYAPSLNLLLAGRALQGLGGAGAMCTARAVGGDAGAGKASAVMLSLMQIISSITPIVMPLYGQAVSAAYGWRVVFWCMAGINVLLLLAVIFLIKETSTTTGRKNPFASLAKDAKAGLTQPAFLLYAVTFGVGISTFFCYVGSSSFVFQNELHMSAGQFSMLFSALAATMVLGGLASSYFTKRIDPFVVLASVVTIQLVDAALVAGLFATGNITIPILAVLFGIIACTESLVIPAGLSLALSEAGAIKGSAAAFCGVFQYCCSMMVTAFLGSVKATGSLGMAAGIAMMITTGCALIAMFSGRALVRRRTANATVPLAAR